MNPITKAIAILFACFLVSCETNTKPAPCSDTKVVTEWGEWKTEVLRVLCSEIQNCSDDPDQGLQNVGYGYAVTLYVKEYTPCRAAKAIIESHRAQQKRE